MRGRWGVQVLKHGMPGVGGVYLGCAGPVQSKGCHTPL